MVRDPLIRWRGPMGKLLSQPAPSRLLANNLAARRLTTIQVEIRRLQVRALPSPTQLIFLLFLPLKGPKTFVGVIFFLIGLLSGYEGPVEIRSGTRKFVLDPLLNSLELRWTQLSRGTAETKKVKKT